MIFDQMREKIAVLLKEIYLLPFNQELSQGILPNEKFIFYLIQDALYLADFGKALALTAARCSQQVQIQKLLRFALDAIEVERSLHLNYLKNYTASDISQTEQNFSCFAYTNYLLKMASLAPVEEAVASLLPCFWVYREVGNHILLLSAEKMNHPYRAWIECYSSELFSQSVDSMIEITNNLGAVASETTQRNMISAFICSTKLEYLFWKSAYEQEMWDNVVS